MEDWVLLKITGQVFTVLPFCLSLLMLNIDKMTMSYFLVVKIMNGVF